MKKRLFLSLNLAFLAGISWGIFSWPWFSLVFFFFLVLFFSPRKFLIFILFLGGAIWGRWSLISRPAKLEKLTTGQSSFVAQVCAEPDHRLSSQKVVLCSPQGKALLNLKSYPEYQYGDLVKFSGSLKKAEEFEGFDYPSYLLGRKIYFVSYYSSLEKIGEKKSFYRSLLVFKEKCQKVINRALPEPEAGLASALVLGYKSTLPDDLLDSFSGAGLSHVIAVSGTHITFLAFCLYKVLKYLPSGKRFNFWLLSIFLFSYTLLSGFQAAAIRSLIMGLLCFWQEAYGRERDFSGAFFFSASLMLFFNPWLLKNNLGFQLSFAAIASLLYLDPFLAKIKFRLWRSWPPAILESFRASVSAQIFVWPLIAYSFHNVSLVSPLSNIFFFWIFYPMIIMLLISMALSALWPLAGPIFFCLPSILLTLFWRGSAFLSKLPGAVIKEIYISSNFVFVYYLVLILGVYLPQRYLDKKKD